MKLDIFTHGSDARAPLCRDALTAVLGERPSLPFSALHILPIPSTKDGLHIRTTDTALLSLPAEGEMIVGYGLPKDVTDAAARVGCAVCDVAQDEAFTLENAHLTAVGTVGHLLTHCPRAPQGLRVGIIGYGRIGQELCRLLLFLDARVRIYTGRESVRRSLGAYGIETRSTAVPETVSFTGLDVLINTAPTAGLIRADSEGLPPILLELASGKNIEEGVSHTPLPSLPAVMFPISAAEAYARSALRTIQGYF